MTNAEKGGDHSGAGLDLAWRAIKEILPVIHHEDTVGYLHHQILVVLDDDDRRPARA